MDGPRRGGRCAGRIRRQVGTIIASAEATNRWALYDRDPLAHWTSGRVALLGDAAHPMLPYMAQAAVQAIEDAAVLAKCLERTNTCGVDAALRRYEEIRQPRTLRCQEGSRQNGTIYHLADGEEQRKRDAGHRLREYAAFAAKRLALWS
jgi:salicylate hydroxylase